MSTPSETSQADVETQSEAQPEAEEQTQDEQPSTSAAPDQNDSQPDPDEEASPETAELRGQVAQFRPRRVQVSQQDEIQEADGSNPSAVGITQLHKPTASAYALLEEKDSKSNVQQNRLSQDMNAEENVSTMDIGETSEMFTSSIVLHKKASAVSKVRWRKFKRYVYNSETNAYCNRTLSNWCAICSYYFCIIIIFLAIFMIYILSFVWRDTEKSMPAFLKITIMPDPNPALAIVPLDQTKSDMLLWYKTTGSNRTLKDNVEEIATFLAKQDLTCHQNKLLDKPCHFSLDDFGPCAEANYGYDENKPCIFLKLNNLLTWMPAPIPTNYMFDPTISSDLKKKIREEGQRHCVYVDCRGETMYDQNYLGKINYYPEAAFDVKYFPATQEVKTNPLIAIKLDELQVGHVVKLHCTLMAGNIKHKENSNIKLTLYIN